MTKLLAKMCNKRTRGEREFWLHSPFDMSEGIDNSLVPTFMNRCYYSVESEKDSTLETEAEKLAIIILALYAIGY